MSGPYALEMFRLLLTLHVLLAIFLVGPLTMIPMTALRSIRRRDAPALHAAARQTMLFGFASLLVFLLGFGVVSAKSKEFSVGDPWIVISMTLYIVALVLALLVLVPDLRRAGKLIEHGVLAAAPPTPEVTAEDDAEPAEPTLTATASDLATKQRLDSLRGRAAAMAGLVTLLFAVIIVLMVVKPFS